MPAASSLLILLLPALWLSARPADPDPSPALSPADVVRIQVEALQHNDDPYPDAGIETTFGFASPENRAATGPLPRFAAMVHGPTYRDMIGFLQADFGDPVVDGAFAAQRVSLTHADGRQATYVFRLSQQDGGRFDGCWMTDGVVRRDLPQAPSYRG